MTNHIPGVVYDMPNEQYHADQSVSSSQLVTAVSESYRHFWDVTPMNPSRPEREETDAMRIGSAMHCYLLERDQFERRYLVLPEDTNLRTNAGKAVRDELQAKAAANGGAVLKSEEMADLISMAKALGEQEVELKGKMWKLADLFKHGKPEVSFFWVDPISGLPCRVRVDWLIEIPGVLNLIIDYKTTISAKRAKFQNDAGGRYYWMRQAMYVDGVKSATGIHYDYLVVAQEKKGPKLGQAFTYEPELEACGRELYRETLLKIKGCLETKRWPGYPPQIQRLDIPSWILWEHPGLPEIAAGTIVPTHIHDGD